MRLSTPAEPNPPAPDLVVVVGRPTFDLASASDAIARLVAACDATTIVAANGAVLDSPAAVADALQHAPGRVRRLIVLFASFADSRLAAEAVDRVRDIGTIVLWSLPEEWTGGRLRRNSLCGANLAAYRLVREGHEVVSVHTDPVGPVDESIDRALTARDHADVPVASWRTEVSDAERRAAEAAVDTLAATRLGVIGSPPDGFEPCEVDRVPSSVVVEHVELDALFTAARSGNLSPAEQVVTQHTFDEILDLAGTDAVRLADIDATVALDAGAERLAGRRGWNALAIRCWPECFGEWGGAACAAMAEMNDHGLPAACEADALGALTMRLAQSIAGRPAFLADLVDADPMTNRLAFWHCGVAPRSLAADPGEVAVALHPNRHAPLVFDFGLAEGPVTIVRLSNGPEGLRLVVGEGTITGEQPFSGTSCAVETATPVGSLLTTVFAVGLEHHVALIPGHHQRVVEAVGDQLGIPVIALTGPSLTDSAART